MPWPSTSTIHFVPFPRLVFPTAAPLFWPTRSCHPERFRPIAVVAADSARPATAATPPAKPPRLPTAADAASRSRRWDTRRARRATERRCATPRECLPRTAGSMPTVGPVRRAADSARETNPQLISTAAHSASCQQLSPVLPCRISACLEAEPIYETSSRTGLFSSHQDPYEKSHKPLAKSVAVADSNPVQIASVAASLLLGQSFFYLDSLAGVDLDHLLQCRVALQLRLDLVPPGIQGEFHRCRLGNNLCSRRRK